MKLRQKLQFLLISFLLVLFKDCVNVIRINAKSLPQVLLALQFFFSLVSPCNLSLVIEACALSPAYRHNQ